MFLSLCEDPNVLSVILLVKYVINIIRIIVPVILILMVSIDFVKGIVNPDERKNPPLSLTLSRLIGAIFVFLLPLLINILMDMLDKGNYQSSQCWKNANIETIDSYKINSQNYEENRR